MTESRTIYCKLTNLEEIARLLRSYFPSFYPSDGESITVRGSAGSLRLTNRLFREPGDNFCRMMLGIRTFIKNIESVDPVRQQAVVDHLDRCDLAIGIVADPAFDADERYQSVVLATAKALDGVIFNGTDMLDANGESLLASG